MLFKETPSGIIALDIDGTITVEHHSIDPDVVAYLHALYQQGWRLIFITGRTFSWGYQVLRHLPFSYFFAVQNGAIILEMPQKRVISKKYMKRDVLPVLEEICSGEPSDYVVYGGFEHNDACYYRPAFFDASLLNYLKRRIKVLEENWIELEQFDQMPIDEFPSVKCFGHYDSIERIVSKIQKHLNLHVPLIRDPFNSQYYVAQATHPEADKGDALREFIKQHPMQCEVVVAGDDLNDLPMLVLATCKIVMNTAPAVLQEMADVIAPSAADRGIIQGLQQALKLIKKPSKYCRGDFFKQAKYPKYKF